MPCQEIPPSFGRDSRSRSLNGKKMKDASGKLTFQVQKLAGTGTAN
jgi:hypothetical protein